VCILGRHFLTVIVRTSQVVCDINAEMLGEGRRRSVVNNVSADGVQLEWVRGDAETLPFPDKYF
jgi:ubiquinone/menaquinone biosynthesis C-methylase UbiE